MCFCKTTLNHEDVHFRSPCCLVLHSRTHDSQDEPLSQSPIRTYNSIPPHSRAFKSSLLLRCLAKPLGPSSPIIDLPPHQNPPTQHHRISSARHHPHTAQSFSFVGGGPVVFWGLRTSTGFHHGYTSGALLSSVPVNFACRFSMKLLTPSSLSLPHIVSKPHPSQ